MQRTSSMYATLSKHLEMWQHRIQIILVFNLVRMFFINLLITILINSKTLHFLANNLKTKPKHNSLQFRSRKKMTNCSIAMAQRFPVRRKIRLNTLTSLIFLFRKTRTIAFVDRRSCFSMEGSENCRVFIYTSSYFLSASSAISFAWAS